MNKQIIIVGAFCEIIELAEDNGFEIVGLIDNEKSNVHNTYNILCDDSEANSLSAKLKRIPLVITPDSPETRQRLFEYYNRLGFDFASLISKDSRISKSSFISLGTIVQAGVYVSADCNIGRFVKLNINCNLMHNASIGDFTTIAPSAVVLGCVRIGSLCYIGANVTILPNIKICDNVIIGAGAVVTKSLTRPGIYAGSPAKLR